MRKITEVFVHCAATPPDWMADASAYDKREVIDKWHKERGFDGFGYHYLIDRDGVTIPGRPEERVGAHVKGYNTNSIGVCLVGGHGSSENDQFADHFTAQQDAALRELLDDLAGRYPDAKVRGHNEVAAKACPGFNVKRWMAAPAKPRASPAQSTTMQAGAAQAVAAVSGGASAIGALDGTAQIVALAICGVVLLAALWIMRERLQKWAEGDR